MAVAHYGWLLSAKFTPHSISTYIVNIASSKIVIVIITICLVAAVRAVPSSHPPLSVVISLSTPSVFDTFKTENKVVNKLTLKRLSQHIEHKNVLPTYVDQYAQFIQIMSNRLLRKSIKSTSSSRRKRSAKYEEGTKKYNSDSLSDHGASREREGHIRSSTLHPDSRYSVSTKEAIHDEEDIVEYKYDVSIPSTEYTLKHLHTTIETNDPSYTVTPSYTHQILSTTASSSSVTAENVETEDGKEALNVAGIALVSITSIIISASIFASNLLVIIPFTRCSRIRTPSNYLLFTLSLSDILVGLVVIPIVTFTTILRYEILILVL